MRSLAIDAGEKRIGVAAAESETGIAVPLPTLHVAGDAVAEVVRLVAEHRADELIVGLPLSLSGAVGPQAERTLALVEALRERLDIPVHTTDERLSTVQASRYTPATRRAKGRGAHNRDSVAAALVLQAFLDARRTRP